MLESSTQFRDSGPGQHLVLYDGVCGFCSAVVQAILRRDRRGLFHFAALQSPPARAVLGQFGVYPDALQTFYVVLDYRGASARCLAKGRAALAVMTLLEWPWKAVAPLQRLPVRILDAAYDLVARHRYRILGGRTQCFLPGPELRSRFVDCVSPVEEGPR